MMKRHHVSVDHVHGRYFCSGHHGTLDEVAAALLRDGHAPDTAIEIVDAPSGRLMLGADEPLSALRVPRPMSEVFGKRGGG